MISVYFNTLSLCLRRRSTKGDDLWLTGVDRSGRTGTGTDGGNREDYLADSSGHRFEAAPMGYMCQGQNLGFGVGVLAVGGRVRVDKHHPVHIVDVGKHRDVHLVGDK